MRQSGSDIGDTVRVGSKGGTRIAFAGVALFALVGASLAVVWQFPAGTPAGQDSGTPSTPNTFADLPIYFERNLGQTDSSVMFLVRRGNHTVFLRKTDLAIALDGQTGRNLVKMKMAGGATETQIEGLEPLPGRSNYIIGNDRAKWRTGVPHFRRVACRQVYPGIDLLLHGAAGEIEFDLVVAPGVDPGVIRLEFEGAERLALDDSGNLLVSAGATQLVQRAPSVYQELDGQRGEVQGQYVLEGTREVRFDIGDYDTSLPLVIDPRIAYSTYLGGSGNQLQYAYRIAVDAVGNAFVMGDTTSADFPTENAYDGSLGDVRDVFVAKLNSRGTGLIYSTYLGGSSEERYGGMTVGPDGNAYVAGSTFSSDFPTVGAFQGSYAGGQDGFVTKLSSSGTALAYSTYMGGSLADFMYGIAVDRAGRAHVTGYTYAVDFPTKGAVQKTHGGGNQDAFVAKLKASGNALVYSSYLGGEADDRGADIGIDPAGAAYVAGVTESVVFPTKNAYQATYGGGPSDAFIAKFAADGSSLAYSSYLGGDGADVGRGVAVDDSGKAYAAGWTYSSDFPTANAFQGTRPGAAAATFVTKMSAQGTAADYSTYLGGSAYERTDDIAIDAAGCAYVPGTTNSSDFPTINSFGIRHDYSRHSFLSKLDPAGTKLIYSSFLGGTDDDWGRSVAVDSMGAAYLLTRTNSTDFPTVNAFQGSLASATEYDAVITKVAECLDFWISAAQPGALGTGSISGIE